MPSLQGKHPDRIGDESDAYIIARLRQAGYDILLPFGKNHRYDLVIEDAEGKFWKVQCKTGSLDDEGTVIGQTSMNSKEQKTLLKLLDGNGQVWYHSACQLGQLAQR